MTPARNLAGIVFWTGLVLGHGLAARRALLGTSLLGCDGGRRISGVRTLARL